jgi:polygalacturonase
VKLTRICVLLACCTASLRAELVVTPEDFGAVGDGKANDWIPIKEALGRCSVVVYNVTAPQSCRVLFTKSYLTGPLIINSSHTTLEVVTGAKLTLLPRPNFKQYFNALISNSPGVEGCRTVYPNPSSPTSGYKVCLSDVTITGGGTIDGGATWDPSSWWLCARLFQKCWRPYIVHLTSIEGISVSGSLTLLNSPDHFMKLEGNVGARASGLTINGTVLSTHICANKLRPLTMLCILFPLPP